MNSAICQQIVALESYYVMSFKGNQGTLYADVKLYLINPSNHELINENNDKGYGHLEQRVLPLIMI
jgi:hypothetical protein